MMPGRVFTSKRITWRYKGGWTSPTSWRVARRWRGEDCSPVYYNILFGIGIVGGGRRPWSNELVKRGGL